MMNTLKTPEDMPLEVKMLSNVVESSQKKIEGRNFAIRKSVLQYDDVMNRQRELIYSQRDQVLNEDDISEIILKMIDGCVNEPLTASAPTMLQSTTGISTACAINSRAGSPSRRISATLRQGAGKKLLLERAHKSYHDREELFGKDANGVPVMRELEKRVLLSNVDRNWMDHIDAMDQLRKGIGLRHMPRPTPSLPTGRSARRCLTA